MNKQKLFKIRNETSQTFCLAKFHEATIWVYSGKIASCHHTPLIPVGNTINTFYNPTEKREQQKSMLAGEQPPACNVCWNFEKLNEISDRHYKSMKFKDHLPAENYLDPTYDFKPKDLELAFQNTCNLACSYCSPQFSSSWTNDIRNNGIYTGIITDGDYRHYQQDIDELEKIINPPDMNLFWEWFATIASGLETIRVTGGEPLMHEEVFKLFDMMIEINPNVECVIHTNLCQKPAIINRFLENIKRLTNLRVNVSNESAGQVAEFIREGMIYNKWLHNMELLCNSSVHMVTVSTTCSAISLQSLDEMYLDIINMRRHTILKPVVSINLVNKPDFQGFGCMSREERDFYVHKYTTFYASIKDDILPREVEYAKRLIKMLDAGQVNDNQLALRRDSDTFFEQYTRRRNKPVNFALSIGKK